MSKLAKMHREFMEEFWCECKKEHDAYYVDDGVSKVCSKHHWCCNNCDKIQKFKPILSSPIIKMAGERPVEAALEQSAAAGLF